MYTSSDVTHFLSLFLSLIPLSLSVSFYFSPKLNLTSVFMLHCPLSSLFPPSLNSLLPLLTVSSLYSGYQHMYTYIHTKINIYAF